MATKIEVNAEPVKRFFIDIITRDIGLIPAILDLVDNSIDSARRLRPQGSYRGLTIDLVAKGDTFSIKDNCGGIAVDHARDYVFRMGRPSDSPPSLGSIGQFGVGLKRSLFKLGGFFSVTSTTESSRFNLELDVAKWEKTSDWSLEMAVEAPQSYAQTGTKITVERLHPAVLEAFAREAFEAELRQELSSRHRLSLGTGLKIELNGTELAPAPSDVASSELVTPAVYTFSKKNAAGEALNVRIVVGVAPSATNGIDEDAEPEEASFPAQDAGWSVFANERMLIANDRTRLTGWGSGKNKLPMFHNQYARFRGFVFLSAENSGAIPWNTMKTSVDPDDPVWQEIVEEMIHAGRGVVIMLNGLKVERTAGLSGEDAPISEALYTASRMVAADPHITGALLGATRIDGSQGDGSVLVMSIESLRDDAKFPAPSAAASDLAKRITYHVDLDDFEAVAAHLGVRKAVDVGKRTFDWFNESKVGRADDA